MRPEKKVELVMIWIEEEGGGLDACVGEIGKGLWWRGAHIASGSTNTAAIHLNVNNSLHSLNRHRLYTG